jgi:hypothetical protein
MSQGRWMAKCPSHEDRMPSLSITQGDKGALLKCFGGCSLEAILQSMGLNKSDIFTDDSVYSNSVEEAALDEGEIIARDYWYTEVLDSLPLTEEHRSELANRGLSDEEIAKFGFRTWDRQKASKIAPNREIPGYTTKDGWKRFSGLVMPVLDPKGRIWAICIKNDSGTPKYSWLSSDGKLGRVCLFQLEDPTKPIVVVEGILKAYVAASLGGHQNFIGLGGTSSWRAFSEWSKSQKAKRTFHIAYDQDQKEATIEQLEKLRSELVNQGHKVTVLLWDGKKAKGIDDAYKSGVPVRGHDWSANKPKPRGIGGDGSKTNGSLKVQALSEIQTRKIEWLVDGWIPLGTFTKLDGDPGDGKGFLITQWCARLTNGDCFMGTARRQDPRNCIIINNEDDPECVTGPRLVAAGADPERVFVVQTNESPFYLPRDIQKLEDLIDETGASFVVLDPFPSFIDPSVNTVADKDVRSLMVAVAGLAARKNCAIMGVFHMNKGSDQRAMYRSSGSVAFNGQARTAFMLLKHPTDENKRVVWNFKNNWGKLLGHFDFQFHEGQPAAQLKFSGKCDLTIDEVLKGQHGTSRKDLTKDITDWIKLVVENGKTLDEMELLCHRVGISWSQCRKIIGEICIVNNQSVFLKEKTRGKIQPRQGVQERNRRTEFAPINEGLPCGESSPVGDEWLQGLQRGLEIYDPASPDS